MHLHTACLLACISLQLSGAVGNWEVINDVKPYDESGTQDDILSREEFLPFRASKPRPKPAPQKNVDSSNSKKVTKAPSLPVKGGNYIGEEELLPLGVQNHGNRRLLQVPVVQGPKLSPEMELLRRQLPSEAVNLSSACKESDDSDCLFNVDEYLAKQITSRTLEKAEQDFEFDDKERDIVHVRHKRQAQTAPDPDDINDEGSGTSDTDNVYTNTTAQVDEGQYYIKTEVGFIVGGATVTDEQKKQYQNVIENQMAFIFSSIPGFSKTIVGELVLE
ncbi:uncharacterized protein [Littorina saxatilis]|uniref:uncharacterized protein n=1 Tax=Littorina saxatilis TaxID=31220 RepID=UPI0038B60B8C